MKLFRKKDKSLSSQILIILQIVIGISSIGLFLIVNNYSEVSFMEFSSQFGKQQVNDITQIIDMKMNTYLTLTIDYQNWDDMYEFVNDPGLFNEEEFINVFPYETIESYQLDLVYMVDQNNLENSLILYNNTIYDTIDKKLLLNNIQINLIEKYNDNTILYYNKHTNKPYILQISKVRKTDGETNGKFYLIVQKEFDINKIYNEDGLFTSLRIISNDMMEEQVSSRIFDYSDPNVIKLQPRDRYSQNFYFYKQLPSYLTDQTIYLEQIFSYHQIARYIRSIKMITHQTLFGYTILFIIFLKLLIDQFVINKIKKIDLALKKVNFNKITDTGNILGCDIIDNNEIGSLYRNINSFLSYIKIQNDETLQKNKLVNLLSVHLTEIIFEMNIEGKLFYNNLKFKEFVDNTQISFFSTQKSDIIGNIYDKLNFYDEIELNKFRSAIDCFSEKELHMPNIKQVFKLYNWDKTNFHYMETYIIPKYKDFTFESLIITMKDITHEVQTSNDYKYLFNTTTDLIFILNESFKIIDFNNQTFQNFPHIEKNKNRICDIILPKYHNDIQYSVSKITENSNCVNIEIETINGLFLEFSICKIQQDNKIKYLQIQRNVTDSIITRKELENKNQIDSLIAKTSKKFLEHKTNIEFHDLLKETFEEFGNLCKQDRLYLVEKNPDDTWSNTIEWANEDVPPSIDMLQNLDMSEFPMFWNRIVNNKDYLYIPSIKNLPNNQEKQILQQQNIETLIVYFIQNNDGKTNQFVGLDGGLRINSFLPEQVKSLQLLKDIIEQKIRMIEYEQQIKEQKQFYHTLFNNIPNYIYVVDKNYNIVDMNPSFMVETGIISRKFYENTKNKQTIEEIKNSLKNKIKLGFPLEKIIDEIKMETIIKEVDTVINENKIIHKEDGCYYTYDLDTKEKGIKKGFITRIPIVLNNEIHCMTIFSDFTNEIEAKFELEKQKQLYNIIYQNIPNIIYITDQQNNIIDMNQQFMSKTGIVLESFIKKQENFECIEKIKNNLLNNVSPKTLNKLPVKHLSKQLQIEVYNKSIKEIVDIIEKGQPILNTITKFYQYDLDRKIEYVLDGYMSKIPFMVNDEIHIMSIFSDLSQEIRQKKELLEKNEQFSNLLQSLPDIVFKIQKIHNTYSIIFYNKDQSIDVLNPKKIEDFVKLEYIDKVYESLNEDRVISIEIEHLDNRDYQYTILPDNDFITIQQIDITASKEQERYIEAQMDDYLRSLNEERNILQSIIDSIPDIIFYKNMNLQYIKVNKQFTNFINRDIEQIVGKHNLEIVDDISLDPLPQYMTLEKEVCDTLQTKTEMFTFGKIYKNVTIGPVFNKNTDKPIGVYGIAHDITEIQSYNTKLNTIQNMLSKISNQQLSKDHIINDLIKEVKILFNCDDVYSYVRQDLDAMNLDIIEMIGQSGVFLEYRGNKVQTGTGIQGRVYQKCQPMYISDLSSWEDRDKNYDELHKQIKEIYVVPMYFKNVVYGTLGIQNKKLSDNDIKLLQSIAFIYSIILYNNEIVRLFTKQLSVTEIIKESNTKEFQKLIDNIDENVLIDMDEDLFDDMIFNMLLMPTPMIMCDIEMVIIFQNFKAIELFNLKSDKKLNLDLISYVVKKDRKKMVNHFNTVLTSPIEQTYTELVEFVNVNEPVKSKHFEVHSNAIFNKHNHMVVGYRCTFIDKTTQIELDTLIQSSRNTTKQLLESMSDIMFRVKMNGNIVNFKTTNPNEESFILNNIMGKNIREIFSRELQSKINEKFIKQFNTNDPESFQFEFVKDGVVRFFNQKIFYNEKDEFIVILQKLNGDYSKQLRKLELLEENIPNIIIEFDQNGILFFVDRSLLKILGYEELEELDIVYDIIRYNDVAVFKKQVNETLNKNKDINVSNITFVSKDGSKELHTKVILSIIQYQDTKVGIRCSIIVNLD